MSPAPRVLPDVEAVLIDWLSLQLDNTALCVTALPADLADTLPVLQVRRVTGAVTGSARIQDSAVVDVNAYQASDEDASELARRVEALLLAARGVTTGGAVVRGVESVTRPRWLPYPDTAVMLYGATYTIRLHPAPLAD